jgi:hypothetical protein
MNFTDTELVEFVQAMTERANDVGLTGERIETFIQVLLKTKNPEHAHAAAIEGLTISPDDEAFVRSILGGNPLAQILREREGG